MIAKTAKQMRQALFGFIKRQGEPLQVTGLSDELIDNVRLMQHVGFASDLPVDSQVVMLPMGGRSTNMVIIASGDAPIVVTANEGETVIYDQFGHEIRLGKDGVSIKGDLQVTGDIIATGQVSDNQGSMTEIRSIYNTHNHSNDGASPPSKQMN